MRLRSAARPDALTTKKIAIIKRKFNENRNNINAYVRFKIDEDAKKSCDLNGSEFKNHFIRVDLATAKDGTSSVRDQSKAVFLGNLSFKVDENTVRSHFSKCGDIEDVRLVRDSSTGIGKGFGYVNFKTTESVELALKLNGSLLTQREIRVSRATNKVKKPKHQPSKPSKALQQRKTPNMKAFPSKSGKKPPGKRAHGHRSGTGGSFQGKIGMKLKKNHNRTKNKHGKAATAKKSRKFK